MFPCNKCKESFSTQTALERHQGDCGNEVPAKKRKLDPSSCQNVAVNIDEGEGPSTSSSKYCDVCKKHIPKNLYHIHQKSLKHKNNACSESGTPGVQILKSGFQSRVATYRITSSISTSTTDVHKFMSEIKEQVNILINEEVKKHVALKVNMEMFSECLLQTKQVVSIKSFNTKNIEVFEGSDLHEIYDEFVAIINRKSSEFQESGSGWTLHRLLHLEVNINKYNPMKASRHIILPEEIRKKKAVLNINNEDQQCFKWCVLAGLHRVDSKNHPNRYQKYLPYKNELNFKGIPFPVKLSDISRFEKQNDISVKVFGLGKKNDVIGPLYCSSSRESKRHFDLLYITKGNNSHYCLIRDMSRLVGRQLSLKEHRKFICKDCLLYFGTKKLLDDHRDRDDCNHTRTTLPETALKKDKTGKWVQGNILKFNNFEKKLKIPFVVYADFESILKPVESCEPNAEKSYTVKTHKHEPYSFAYYIKCSYDDSLSKFISYRGPNSTKKFIKDLEADVRKLYNKYLKHVKEISGDMSDFENSLKCHICEIPFSPEEEKVRDHCHLTGEYRGAAHSACNLNYKIPKFIPVFFHHLSRYDAHLFIKDLASAEQKIDVIALNKENYISFSKHILVEKGNGKNEQNLYLKLRFLDSFRFMACGLDKLARNLEDSQCREVLKYYSDETKFGLLRQKGIFPYSYVDSSEKLQETKLPSHKEFYNTLTKQHVSDDDYKRACEVFNLFECKTLGDYSDIYLKTDVLLLADVFENFRDVCLRVYKLDPAQYFTAPGLTWDAMLKHTKINLELLIDIDMVNFFKTGIRGGVSQCSVRKCIANNKFVPNFDASKPTSYIMYLDATNLYGAAMSEKLPTGGFQWLQPDEVEIFNISNIPDDSNIGYVLEVDLEYPENLHDAHNDLPFCVESKVSPGAKVKMKKLIPNLEDKHKYIIHYKNLKQALDNGLILKKIHRVLRFNQSPWIKSYIDLNTDMRNKTSKEFEKDFFKLMNNSVFGKTMENVEKRVNVKLVTHWKNIGKKYGAQSLIAKPTFKNLKIFSENLIAVQMSKDKVCYDKPIYAGFCILDLSKTIIYDFFYNFIKKKYGSDATLLYTDTDSLILEIVTENFYEDMKIHLDKFDTSKMKPDNIHGIPVNKSVLGNMKDEYNGNVIREFYGTGSKAYYVDVGDKKTKKAKGVANYITNKELSVKDYKLVVENEGSEIHRKINTFHSYEHNMYTVMTNQVALSHFDDKRFVIPKSTRTLAWGHKNIPLHQGDATEI